MNSLVNELKAHQLVLIFMCAAIGTLVAFAFLSTVQSLCFGLITGVFTYSFLLSRAEHEENIKFTDFEPFDRPPEEARAQAEQEFAPVAQTAPPAPFAQSANVQPQAAPALLDPALKPTGVYKRKYAHCWKCNDEMYLYTWDGHRRLDTTQPPDPIPETVQQKWSNLINGKYWANVCMKCGSAQNDEAIFDEHSGGAWEEF